jgi:hypothetical protein
LIERWLSVVEVVVAHGSVAVEEVEASSSNRWLPVWPSLLAAT